VHVTQLYEGLRCRGGTPALILKWFRACPELLQATTRLPSSLETRGVTLTSFCFYERRQISFDLLLNKREVSYKEELAKFDSLTKCLAELTQRLTVSYAPGLTPLLMCF
jgi:hypothetical protein